MMMSPVERQQSDGPDVSLPAAPTTTVTVEASAVVKFSAAVVPGSMENERGGGRVDLAAMTRTCYSTFEPKYCSMAKRIAKTAILDCRFGQIACGKGISSMDKGPPSLFEY